MTSAKKFGTRQPANKTLLAWVESETKLCEPDRIFWCDGSDA